MGELPDAQARLIDQATAATGSASLSDIQHVVILMQENRSFDHYFGTLSGVRGFSDPNTLSQSVGGQAHPIIETRFGVVVPNLSPWRRSVTGDMTAALTLSRPPDTSIPALPPTSLGPTSAAEQAVLNSLAGTLDLGIDYPLPTANSMPSQETSPTRPPVP
jgi:phospholipase C